MWDLDEMKLARVIDACGGVDGRVKLQKIAYLLKSMGYDLPFDDFWIRQYGPYSRAVACSTDLLASGGFVKETEFGLGMTNPSGEQAKRYSYEVSDSIKPLLHTHFDLPAPKDKPPIDEIGPELRQVDRATLEVAATKLFLEREEERDGEALEAELQRLKGHLAESFAKADQLLEQWKERGLL